MVGLVVGPLCIGPGGFRGRLLLECLLPECLKVEPFASSLSGCCSFHTGFTLIWMGFMGNAALFSIIQDGHTSLISAVQQDSSVALFEFLTHLPFSQISSLIATVLVVLFFVTSADSGSLVIDYLTAETENSPLWQRLFWTILIALLSIILLMAGGLSALQSATIMSALPFTLIMLLVCWGLLKALRLDVTKMRALQRCTNHATCDSKSTQLATASRSDYALSTYPV